VMTRGHQVPAGEALALASSSVRCDIVDDVFTVLRRGDATLHDLDQIKVPTLILWGDHDRILPIDVHSPRLRAEIPGVQFRVVRGVGHTPMWDDPGLFAQAIVDHVSAAVRAAPESTVAA
jgi:pimeloyl-ACP methyl ester carboxylesterase